MGTAMPQFVLPWVARSKSYCEDWHLTVVWKSRINAMYQFSSFMTTRRILSIENIYGRTTEFLIAKYH